MCVTRDERTEHDFVGWLVNFRAIHIYIHIAGRNETLLIAGGGGNGGVPCERVTETKCCGWSSVGSSVIVCLVRVVSVFRCVNGVCC